MKICPSCSQHILQRNYFSGHYKCKNCEAVYSLTSGQRAIEGLLFVLLPLAGMFAGIFSQSALLFLFLSVIVPILACWWLQQFVFVKLLTYSPGKADKPIEV